MVIPRAAGTRAARAAMAVKVFIVVVLVFNESDY
jgi:hypothetical protein